MDPSDAKKMAESILADQWPAVLDNHVDQMLSLCIFIFRGRPEGQRSDLVLEGGGKDAPFKENICPRGQSRFSLLSFPPGSLI